MIPSLFTIFVLLLFSALFSGSEVAFFSIPKHRLFQLAHSPDIRDRLIASLLENPQRFLVNVLFANLLVNIAANTIATGILVARFNEEGVGITIVIMSAIIILFGEITPKNISIYHSRGVAKASSPLLKILFSILYPITSFISLTSSWAVRAVAKTDERHLLKLDEVEMKTALLHSHIGGILDETEHGFILRILEMSDIPVSKILLNRRMIPELFEDTPKEDMSRLFSESGLPFLPVLSPDRETVIGVMRREDIIFSDSPRMMPPLFLPENMHLFRFFEVLEDKGKTVAIMVDESGSYTGIMWMDRAFGEAVLSLLPNLLKLEYPSVGEYTIIEGDASVEKLSQLFGKRFEGVKSVTVGGLVTEVAGRLPSRGEKFECEGLELEVIETEGNLVTIVAVREL
ncbi:MAG: hypothetical protein B6D65_01940 [candidate division Zixibacteria bacterium 4484_93]|nr:MAG: hypothetical protein B6D65_01940 [candidate division Zixibacteria bacterium 4484_93]RKZ33181.1 MAG: hypothetical protein DRQ19_03160 [bacterium]